MGENPSRVLRVLYFSADDAGAGQGKIDCGLMDVKTFSICNAALISAFFVEYFPGMKTNKKQH